VIETIVKYGFFAFIGAVFLLSGTRQLFGKGFLGLSDRMIFGLLPMLVGLACMTPLILYLTDLAGITYLWVPIRNWFTPGPDAMKELKFIAMILSGILLFIFGIYLLTSKVEAADKRAVRIFGGLIALYGVFYLISPATQVIDLFFETRTFDRGFQVESWLIRINKWGGLFKDIVLGGVYIYVVMSTLFSSKWRDLRSILLANVFGIFVSVLLLGFAVYTAWVLVGYAVKFSEWLIQNV
jgi:hypothetical protein